MGATYNGVDQEEDYYRLVCSPICVGQEGSDKRCEEATANPGRDIPRGIHIALVELTHEIGD